MNHRYWTTVFILLVGLTGCTGSQQGGTLDPHVIVAATTAAGDGGGGLNCSPASLPAANTPVLLAYSASGLDAAITGAADARCARVDVQTLAAAATDLAQTDDGARLYVAIPTQGVVQIRDANLNVTGTLQGTAAEPTCPSRLALSPDNLTLAVLDDPSRCPGFARATLRVLVYRTADQSLRGTLTAGLNFPGVVTSGGPAAIAVSNGSVWLLAPQTATINLFRFDLNTADLNTATALPTFGGLPLPGVQSGVLVTATGLLATADGRVYASVNASTQAGQGLVIPVNASRAGFDPALTAEAAGPANALVVDNRRSQFLILQPGQTVIRSAKPAVVNAALQAATVALDGFAYGVNGSVFTRIDLAFSASADVRSIQLGGDFATPTAVAWTLPGAAAPR